MVYMVFDYDLMCEQWQKYKHKGHATPQIAAMETTLKWGGGVGDGCNGGDSDIVLEWYRPLTVLICTHLHAPPK